MKSPTLFAASRMRRELEKHGYSVRKVRDWMNDGESVWTVSGKHGVIASYTQSGPFAPLVAYIRANLRAQPLRTSPEFVEETLRRYAGQFYDLSEQ